jgi:D-sedoheptulose 7-phosphate isomerase
MLEQRIQQHFIDSADLKYQLAQSLSIPLAQAVQTLLACVTSGGKVLACGVGGSATAAQYFASRFVVGFERERPELAAVALRCDGTMLADSRQGGDADQALACQVRALGQAGDVLLTLCLDGDALPVLAAIAAAHERDMSVLALTGRSGGQTGALLRETDVHICVAHDRVARIQELHQLALHCLCDGVDALLLGEQELSG